MHLVIVSFCLLPLALTFTGCETTGVTTLEERRASYEEAVEFLRMGRTRAAAVKEKFGAPVEIKDVTQLEAAELPPSHIALTAGQLWRYWQSDTVLMNAYTDRSMGTDRAAMVGAGGFTHTLTRRTRMDLFFDPYGVLRYYRIWRDAPGR